MKARRTRLAAVLLFLAGCACAATAMEAGLKTIRATPLWRALPVIEPILGRPDRETGYVFMPGVSGIWTTENRAPVTITDLGLRGPDGISVAKPANTLRIAMFGDSMTEALQVDYAATFGALLQDGLNRASGRPVQVINFAMSGSGPLRQLVRLEQRGYAFDPDLVLLIASPFDFMSGELRSDTSHPGYAPDGKGGWVRSYGFRDRFSVRNADTPAGQLFLDTLQHSDLARLVYLRSRDPLPRLFGVEAAMRPASAAGAAVDRCYGAELGRLQRFWQGHEPALDWQATETVLNELAAAAAGRPAWLAYAFRDLPVPASGCTAQQAQRTAVVDSITKLLSARGIAFIDLESRLAVHLRADASADIKVLHGFGLQRGSGHLNHDGHRRYAEVLLDVVSPLLSR